MLIIFFWKKLVSQMLPPVAIFERTAMDLDVHFRVLRGEFLQTHEGKDETMTQSTIDTVALGLNGNMQGGMCCFSLETGRVLQRAWRDVTVHKILVGAIIRIN